MDTQIKRDDVVFRPFIEQGSRVDRRINQNDAAIAAASTGRFSGTAETLSAFDQILQCRRFNFDAGNFMQIFQKFAVFAQTLLNARQIMFLK